MTHECEFDFGGHTYLYICNPEDWTRVIATDGVATITIPVKYCPVCGAEVVPE